MRFVTLLQRLWNHRANAGPFPWRCSILPRAASCAGVSSSSRSSSRFHHATHTFRSLILRIFLPASSRSWLSFHDATHTLKPRRCITSRGSNRWPSALRSISAWASSSAICRASSSLATACSLRSCCTTCMYSLHRTSINFSRLRATRAKIVLVLRRVASTWFHESNIYLTCACSRRPNAASACTCLRRSSAASSAAASFRESHASNAFLSARDLILMVTLRSSLA